MAIAPVQRLGKGGAAVSSLTIGSGDGWATPTAGNLLVATANSDATVTMTTSGFTAGPSVVDGNGAYMWFKVAAGTESTITVTPGSAANTVMTVCEYSGATASPFDVQNSSTISAGGGTTTNAAAITTTAAGDLIVAAALVHAFAGTIPTAPSWTNSFVNVLNTNMGGTTITSAATFVAELTAVTAASYSTVCTWTNNANNRQHIIMAFKAGAAPAARPVRPLIVRQAVGFASTW